MTHQTVKIKPAFGLLLWIMNRSYFKGFTTFFNLIYIHPDYMNDKPLIAHEMTHIRQINEDGIIKFSIKYLYYSCRYGYHSPLHKYEEEARTVQRNTKP